MHRDPEALARQKFDLVIIGGGIQGAATAREAALRGLKVALVDAGDFAGATSSRSSKLIHGGLRYLGQREFHLVHEARRERRLLRRLAPHLAQPVPFLLPIYAGDPYSPRKVRLGLTIYDLLGSLGAADRHRMLSRTQTLQYVPALRAQDLRAGALYYDSRTDDARLTLENILDAAQHGAVVANYVKVRALQVSAGGNGRGAEVTAAEALDQITGRRHEISARFWVNAAGPWVDRLRALLPGYDGSRTVRLTKGTHIIVPPVAGPFALFAAILPGERIFVMPPWNGQALLGTTDTDYDGDPAQVRPDPADTEYLLAAVNRVLRQSLTSHDVSGAFAGLRALAIEPGRSPSENTREYRFHQDPWARNFISVCGGKLTTARALGEKLVDRIAARLGAAPAAGVQPSRQQPLPGGHIVGFGAYVKETVVEAARSFRIPSSAAERVVRTYGSRWREVLERIHQQHTLAEFLPGPEPRCLAAEVDFALREEMAVRVEDFLLRRSGWNWRAAGTLGDAAPAVAQLFAERLGWNAQQRDANLEDFYRHVSLSRAAVPAETRKAET